MAALLRREGWRSMTCGWGAPTTNPPGAAVGRGGGATATPAEVAEIRLLLYSGRAGT